MTSTPHPELHLDIVNLIIDELHSSRSDLKTCALVCRSWVPHSRFHLFSTIRLSCLGLVSIYRARIGNLSIVTNLHIDEELQSPTVFDQLLTWRSPHDGKSIADVFRHLKTLSLDCIKWRPLSQTASFMLHLTFQTVTELRLQHVMFETGDEFLEFLSSLIGLEKLCLHGVSLRAPRQASSAMQSNVFSSRFHTLDLNIVSYYDPSGQVIRAITPYHSLKNLSVHVRNFGDMSVEYSMAVGDLLVSAGPSLENFKFCVELAGVFKRDVDLDARLQHIHLTENSNLRKITLDVDDSTYLVPFLERLTKSHYPPSLEKLHIPRLVPEMDDTPVDYKRINELLRHSYFSALGEFRCRQHVGSGIEEEWYNGRPIEGSWSWKEMESKIEELKAAMPKLADEGILQVDSDFPQVFFSFCQTQHCVFANCSLDMLSRPGVCEDESDETKILRTLMRTNDREREGGKD
ncbi:hypothetical protein K435DRAFT_55748 [Dendrothele bispora CBS 962.96]|uniref:F-box domain-containing protein n=1 Tax=Dendrothele bispora (strain CBS 962.96) TaxID=1314807 RepID=A0A4S8KRP0_DENBC|nr:hypothetical protein K435DRAFT_55748 [Dendrothele bispora CBS 962.96]